MDEFMVSGETIVRNLQLGLRRAAGARRRDARRLPARHVRPRRADAPAPAAAGLRARRGVARRARRRRPDRVLVGGTRRLDGAGRVPATARTRTAATCPTTPRSSSPGRTRLPARARATSCSTTAASLLMNGTDHQLPQTGLGAVVAAANETQDDYRFAITSLAEYLAGAADRRTARRGGASCARGPAPTCSWASRPTGSTCTRRAPRRRAGARAPGRAALPPLFLAADRLPRRAPRRGVAASSCSNSAHDSSCACSDDEVVDAVPRSLQRRRQIADGLVDGQVAAPLADRLAAPRPGRGEPRPASAPDWSSCASPAPNPWPGTQQLVAATTGCTVVTGITRGRVPCSSSQACLDEHPASWRSVRGRRRCRRGAPGPRRARPRRRTGPLRRATQGRGLPPSPPSGPTARPPAGGPAPPSQMAVGVADGATARLGPVGARTGPDRAVSRRSMRGAEGTDDRPTVWSPSSSTPTTATFSLGTVTGGLGRLVDDGDPGRHLQLVPTRLRHTSSTARRR